MLLSLDNDCMRLVIGYLSSAQQRDIVHAYGGDEWRRSGLPCLLSHEELTKTMRVQ
jgi:hypothetical protein